MGAPTGRGVQYLHRVDAVLEHHQIGDEVDLLRVQGQAVVREARVRHLAIIEAAPVPSRVQHVVAAVRGEGTVLRVPVAASGGLRIDGTNLEGVGALCAHDASP